MGIPSLQYHELKWYREFSSNIEFVKHFSYDDPWTGENCQRILIADEQGRLDYIDTHGKKHLWNQSDKSCYGFNESNHTILEYSRIVDADLIYASDEEKISTPILALLRKDKQLDFVNSRNGKIIGKEEFKQNVIGIKYISNIECLLVLYNKKIEICKSFCFKNGQIDFCSEKLCDLTFSMNQIFCTSSGSTTSLYGIGSYKSIFRASLFQEPSTEKIIIDDFKEVDNFYFPHTLKLFVSCNNYTDPKAEHEFVFLAAQHFLICLKISKSRNHVVLQKEFNLRGLATGISIFIMPEEKLSIKKLYLAVSNYRNKIDFFLIGHQIDKSDFFRIESNEIFTHSARRLVLSTKLPVLSLGLYNSNQTKEKSIELYAGMSNIFTKFSIGSESDFANRIDNLKYMLIGEAQKIEDKFQRINSELDSINKYIRDGSRDIKYKMNTAEILFWPIDTPENTTDHYNPLIFQYFNHFKLPMIKSKLLSIFYHMVHESPEYFSLYIVKLLNQAIQLKVKRGKESDTLDTIDFCDNLIKYINEYILVVRIDEKKQRLTSKAYKASSDLDALLLNGLLFFKKCAIYEQVRFLGDNWRIKSKTFKTGEENRRDYIFCSSYFNHKMLILAPDSFRLFVLGFFNDPRNDRFGLIKTFFFDKQNLNVILEKNIIISFRFKDILSEINKAFESDDKYLTHCDSDEYLEHPELTTENINEISVRHTESKISSTVCKSEFLYSSDSVFYEDCQYILLGSRHGNIFVLDLDKENSDSERYFEVYDFGETRVYNPVCVLKFRNNNLLIGTFKGQVAFIHLDRLKDDIVLVKEQKKPIKLEADYISHEGEPITDIHSYHDELDSAMVVCDQGGKIYSLEKKKGKRNNQKESWIEKWGFGENKPITRVSCIYVEKEGWKEDLIVANSLSGSLIFFTKNGILKGRVYLRSPLYTFTEAFFSHNFTPALKNQVKTIFGPTLDGYLQAIDIVDQEYHYREYSQSALNIITKSILDEIEHLSKTIKSDCYDEKLKAKIENKIKNMKQDPSVKEIVEPLIKKLIREDTYRTLNLTRIKNTCSQLSEKDQKWHNTHFGFVDEHDKESAFFKIIFYHAIRAATLKIRSAHSGKQYFRYPYQKLLFDLDTETGFGETISDLRRRINSNEYVGKSTKKIGNVIRYLIGSAHKILTQDEANSSNIISEFRKIIFDLINNWGAIDSATNNQIKKDISKYIFKKLNDNSFYKLLKYRYEEGAAQNLNGVIKVLLNDNNLVISFSTLQNIYQFLEKHIFKKPLGKEQKFICEKILVLVQDSIIEANLIGRSKRWLLIECLRIHLRVSEYLNEENDYYLKLFNLLITNEVPIKTYSFISIWLRQNNVSEKHFIPFEWATDVLSESPGSLERAPIKSCNLDSLNNIKMVIQICEEHLLIESKSLELEELDDIYYVTENGRLNKNEKFDDEHNNIEETLLAIKEAAKNKKIINVVDYRHMNLPEASTPNEKEKISYSELFKIINKHIRDRKERNINDNFNGYIIDGNKYDRYNILYAIRKITDELIQLVQELHTSKTSYFVDVLRLSFLRAAVNKLKEEIEENIPHTFQEAMGTQRIKTSEQFIESSQKTHALLHFAFSPKISKSVILDHRNGQYQITKIDSNGIKVEKKRLESPLFEDFQSIMVKFVDQFYEVKFETEFKTFTVNLANTFYRMLDQNKSLQFMQSVILKNHLMIIMHIENRPYGMYLLEFKEEILEKNRNKYFGLTQLPNFILRNYLLNVEIEKVKRNFEGISANFGHNVRQPVSTLRRTVSQLLRKWDSIEDKDKRSFAMIFRRNTFDLDQRLRRVIRAFAAYREGSFFIETSEFDLVAYLKEITSDIRRLIRGWEVVLMPVDFSDFELDENGHFMIVCDRHYLTDVLFNLIENAAKYSPRKSKIWIDISHTKNKLTFEIRDQGIGIPSDKVDFIFQPFMRLLDDEKHDKYAFTEDEKQRGGFGVGLFVCQYIMEEGFHSRIKYRKNPQGGSIFSFTIPRRFIYE